MTRFTRPPLAADPRPLPALMHHFRFLIPSLPALLLFAACSDAVREPASVPAIPETAPELSPETLASQVAASLSEEEAATLADELRVRPGELALFDYWDALRASERPLQHLAKLPVTSVALPADAPDCTLAQVLSGGHNWPDMLGEIESSHGYVLSYSHWQHVTFDKQANPPRSVVAVELHFNSGEQRTRAICKAMLDATWSTSGPAATGEPPFTDVTMRVTDIDASQDQAFHRLREITAPEPRADAPSLAAPLLVRDLNADHYPEVLALGANLLLWNQADCTFVGQPLAPGTGTSAPEGFRAGAFGEFTGDNLPDLVLIDLYGNLVVLPAAPEGAYTGELLIAAGAPVAAHASSITVADIDGDGDDDLYVAQDKPLFAGGQMPSPPDNAASGHPGHLLRNDGDLQFTDVTEDRVPGEARMRRVRDARFCDYDGDGDPDLLLANRFAPVDILENREGTFAAVTDSVLDGPPAALMANALLCTDLTGNHVPDLLVAAIASNAAGRMETMRGESAASALGNAATTGGIAPVGIAASSSRLLTNVPRSGMDSLPGNLPARSFRLQVAFPDAGWATDAAALDYDNDGDADLYMTNGNISGKSTRDFDLFFWQRELRAATSMEDPVIAQLFTDRFRPDAFQGLNDGRISWQGHQANRLYRNEGDLSSPAFHEVGHLQGAALTEDCRATEAADLDLDGKVDLIVVTESWQNSGGVPLPRQEISVLRNESGNENHWIGLRFDNIPPGISLAGTVVTLDFGGQRRTLVLEEGATTMHLGLGDRKGPATAVIRWPDGVMHHIESPPIDRYISVQFTLD